MITILFGILLLAVPFRVYAAQNAYSREENTNGDAADYPYMVKTPSATWYLAKADIDLLGENACFDGLYSLLEDAEPDFADAREALSGYIPGEIAAVSIYTDFCNQAAISIDKEVAAYYNPTGNFIKLFSGWEKARASLLHEYVHYLTIHFAQPAARHGFWAEGAAEYISNFVCKNRMARSVNLGFDLSAINPEMKEQAWDKNENCLDPRLVYLGLAQIIAEGYIVGTPYFAVKNEWVERTEKIQENPNAQDLTFHEAASMFAYLTETYGKDTVFQNWDVDPLEMETIYEKPFRELYRDWAGWNADQCRLSGITV